MVKKTTTLLLIDEILHIFLEDNINKEVSKSICNISEYGFRVLGVPGYASGVILKGFWCPRDPTWDPLSVFGPLGFQFWFKLAQACCEIIPVLQML